MMANVDPFNYIMDVGGYDVHHLPLDPQCLMAMDADFGGTVAAASAAGEAQQYFQHEEGSNADHDHARYYYSGLGILNFHRGRMEKNRMLRRGGGAEELSAEEIVRLAAAHYIQLSSLVVGDPSQLKLPFGLSLSALKPGETKSVQLVSLLLSAAEKVHNQQYRRAEKLVEQCRASASSGGSPVERVVLAFAEAIKEKMDRETGRKKKKPAKEEAEEGGGGAVHRELNEMLSNHHVQAAVYRKIPFTQIYHFATVQTILDRLEGERRIHMIDLSIKHGLQWTILMQALATRGCPAAIESLKITAVGADGALLASVGRRLAGFADGLGLPFEFRVAVVAGMEELREEMFEVEEGEALAVYSAMDLHACLARPEGVERLLGVVRRLRPRVVTVVDTHGKMNSRCFVSRFTEALFYFSAMYDAVGHFLAEEGDPHRRYIEGTLGPGIRSIVAGEGREREVRHVGVGVWRSYFSRFGLVEDELSDWTAYQAEFILKMVDGGHHCTMSRNGKSLLLGWKGTPLLFVSAWKFQEAAAE